MGKGLSVKELIECFEKTCNVKLNWKFGPRRKGDVDTVYANADKAYQKFKMETTI
jgi:UDP-glucose 4-epimerase